MSDRIEKTVVLNAPLERVWAAIADSARFGAWFGCAVEGPFVAGAESRARILYPGLEHLVMTMQIEAIEPMMRFAYRWHPYAIDPEQDYSAEPTTLVEFRLEPQGEGVILTVVESGFDRIPEARRDKAFRMNESGWAEQAQSIRRYVEG